MKRALITGVTGQDGSYLADLLIEKGYDVHGLVRRTSTGNLSRIQHLVGNPRFRLHFGDMSDPVSLWRVVAECQPDEVYNLAAMSHVHVSFGVPIATADVNGGAVGGLFEAVYRVVPHANVYQAGSSEMFGRVVETPQRETTPFFPRSPYGCAKAYAFHLGKVYRDSHKLRVWNGILFNHESPRRGADFVTKKIAKAVAAIKHGKQTELLLGNLDAVRDWGYAKEYVEGMWRMLQTDTPDDYVLATGEAYSIRDFVSEAFSHAGLDWRQYVKEDKGLFRPAEVDYLLGDASKARRVIGFEPQVRFKELVWLMVDWEMENCSAGGMG
jgi:GDPmannose 4,6-dehydratase